MPPYTSSLRSFSSPHIFDTFPLHQIFITFTFLSNIVHFLYKLFQIFVLPSYLWHFQFLSDIYNFHFLSHFFHMFTFWWKPHHFAPSRQVRSWFLLALTCYVSHFHFYMLYIPIFTFTCYVSHFHSHFHTLCYVSHLSHQSHFPFFSSMNSTLHIFISLYFISWEKKLIFIWRGVF